MYFRFYLDFELRVSQIIVKFEVDPRDKPNKLNSSQVWLKIENELLGFSFILTRFMLGQGYAQISCQKI